MGQGSRGGGGLHKTQSTNEFPGLRPIIPFSHSQIQSVISGVINYRCKSFRNKICDKAEKKKVFHSSKRRFNSVTEFNKKVFFFYVDPSKFIFIQNFLKKKHAEGAQNRRKNGNQNSNIVSSSTLYLHDRNFFLAKISQTNADVSRWYRVTHMLRVLPRPPIDKVK